MVPVDPVVLADRRQRPAELELSLGVGRPRPARLVRGLVRLPVCSGPFGRAASGPSGVLGERRDRQQDAEHRDAVRRALLPASASPPQVRVGVGAVHRRVAVRTARDERKRGVHGARLGDRVTGDADAGLVGLEQRARARPVRRMAVPAVLGDRGMLVDPGTRVVLMAAGAQLRRDAERDTALSVRIVTIGAGDHSLAQRMMGGQIEVRRNVGVTADAHARHALGVRSDRQGHRAGLTQVPGLALVRGVAVRAVARRLRLCSDIVPAEQAC